MEEVTKGVDNIGLTELILDQGHYVWKIRLPNVLAISNVSHEAVKEQDDVNDSSSSLFYYIINTIYAV